MLNGNIVIGDSSGTLSWFDQYGTFLEGVEGSSGVVMMSADESKTLLAVAREREHTFEFYTHQNAIELDLV